MRFYLDENVSRAIANGLKLRGHDVITVFEAENTGMEDKEQIVYANEKGRILITADRQNRTFIIPREHEK